MVNLQTQLKSEVGVLAEYISDELSVFIVAENKPDDHPANGGFCLLYTSPSPRDGLLSRMPSSA